MEKTIIFIHGAWVTPLCWEKFVSFFQKEGFNCIAPAWPYHDAPINDLRSNPAKELSDLGILEIVNYYEKIIKEQKEPPLLIGYSFGGLFVQMLLDRGLGRAGVAIASAPPKGVLPIYYSVIKSIFGMVFPPFGSKIRALSFKDFQYAFVNTFPREEQHDLYEKYLVPETNRIFYQALFAPFTNTTKVNFNKSQRVPLLLIAGTLDAICPAAQIRKNYEKYKKSNAITDFKEFEKRTHWIMAQDGWEEVAEYILEWQK
ncbi:alpha/beta hydrolase [Candidatus Micrarchaeota archaeon]|nr:alpha/beta hydrolase [Candidatus Micrarchaeota archaeon]